MDQEESSTRMNKIRLQCQTLSAMHNVPDEGPNTTIGLLLLIFYQMLSRLVCMIRPIVSHVGTKLPLASMGKAVPMTVLSRSFGKKGSCATCI